MHSRERRAEKGEHSIDEFFGIVTTRVKKQIEKEKRERKQRLEEKLRELDYTVIDKVGDYVVEVQDRTKVRHYVCTYDRDGKLCMFQTSSLIDMARHIATIHGVCDRKLAKELAKKVKEGKYSLDYLKTVLPETMIARIVDELEE